MQLNNSPSFGSYRIYTRSFQKFSDEALKTVQKVVSESKGELNDVTKDFYVGVIGKKTSKIGIIVFPEGFNPITGLFRIAQDIYNRVNNQIKMPYYKDVDLNDFTKEKFVSLVKDMTDTVQARLGNPNKSGRILNEYITK